MGPPLGAVAARRGIQVSSTRCCGTAGGKWNIRKHQLRRPAGGIRGHENSEEVCLDVKCLLSCQERSSVSSESCFQTKGRGSCRVRAGACRGPAESYDHATCNTAFSRGFLRRAPRSLLTYNGCTCCCVCISSLRRVFVFRKHVR